MIPLWKIKRELNRLSVQAQSIPAVIYEPLLQKRYDKNFSENITLSRGTICSTERIAIFLIYPVHSVEKSIVVACHHLIKCGYSPIIVSNTPLSDTEKLRLSNLTLMIIERPNFGYDFGGYRDAVKIIFENKFIPEEILFLNDSVWFPSIQDSEMLQQMQLASATYVGTHVWGISKHLEKREGSFRHTAF